MKIKVYLVNFVPICLPYGRIVMFSLLIEVFKKCVDKF